MNDSDVVRRWAKDPEVFVREALRVDLVTKQQVAGLAAVRSLVHSKLKRHAGVSMTDAEMATAKKDGLSIMSGAGTGKDAFTSWVILWFLFCFPSPKIPCTAPTAHQLRDVLWAEINKWIRHSVRQHKKENTGFDISDWIGWQADRVFYKESRGREWFAIARTCNTKATAEEQAETLQGFHEDHMMIVIDEASGVPDPVFKPLEATMTGKCNFALVIFNPTRSNGFAIDSQQKDRANWITLRWNSEESEIVSDDSIERIAKKYGKDSNPYRIRVLGLPPKADPDTLIPWDWVMSCVEQDVEPLDDDPNIMAIDVGRYGDDASVVMSMHGPVVTRIEEYRSMDTEQLSNWAMSRIFDEEPAAVMVDVIGVGAGVADKLRHRTEANVIDVNVSEMPSDDPGKFHRLRDELWWKLRELFEKRAISIPNDPELIGELTVMKYDMDMGKVKVESKKQLRSRGIASPNKADALCMTQYFGRDYLQRLRRPMLRRRIDSRLSWKTV